MDRQRVRLSSEEHLHGLDQGTGRNAEQEDRGRQRPEHLDGPQNRCHLQLFDQDQW